MPLAVQYQSFGGPGVLDVVEVPELEAAGSKVRLAVRAAGLNPWDTKVRSGWIPMDDPRFPRGIGVDVAGVVEQVGPDARYEDGSIPQVGDEVFGWAERTIAQQVLVPASHLARRPADLPWEVAGAIATAALTAHAALELLAVRDGDLLLVGSAAGAVGFLSSQAAILRGATVIGTSGEANEPMLQAAGIIPLRYGPGLADRVRAVAPGPLTVALDCYGREAVEAALELGVAPGRITTVADFTADQDYGVLTFPEFSRSVSTLDWFAEQIVAGAIRLPIHQAFGLDGARDAYALLETRRLSGKVVVVP